MLTSVAVLVLSGDVAVEAMKHKPDEEVMNVNQEFVTPAMATAMLQNNSGNRTLSAGRVRLYAQIMQSGGWKNNGDVIRIAKDGRLLDGQHRLAAIERSGIGQKFLVVRGLDESVFDTIDTGAARVASDILSIDGFKNSTALASAIKLFLTWKTTGNPVSGSPDKKPTHQEILQFARENAIADQVGALSVTSNFNKKMISPSIIGFLYFAAHSENIPMDDVSDFFSRVADPSLGKTSDVTFMLRDRLMQDLGSKTRLRRYDKIALVIKAFRAWRSGQNLKTLRVRTGGDKSEKDIFRVA